VTILLVVFYVLVCIFLILVVLLQQGKGADLAGAFGGGGSQTSFGPRSASNIMHRMTTGSFILFVVLSLSLAILSGKQRSSVMEAVEAPVVPVAEEAVEQGATEQGATEQGAAEQGAVPSVDEVQPSDGETEAAPPVDKGEPVDPGK
jgi:preprotein translocase subunit SecG